MKNHKKYTLEFKEMVILDLFSSNKSIESICEKYGITYPTLRKWKEAALCRLPLVLYKETSAERMIKELQKENDRLLDKLKTKDIELEEEAKGRFETTEKRFQINGNEQSFHK